MLEYSLHENPLTDSPEDYSAQTHSKSSYNREQFIDLMLQRGTLMTKTDAVAVLNNIEETALYIVKNGGTLNLPLFNTGFSISGIFDGATDAFDPTRHHLHINVNKGVLLRNTESEVRLTKVNVPSPQPQILEVKDSITGKVDEVLTSSGVVEIDGVNIKISGDKPACGLYFNSEDGAETKAVTIVYNKPSSLIVVIPALAPGNYRIKLITQFSGGKDWNEPKTTVYPKLLVVN